MFRKNLSKFTREYTYRSFFFNKVASVYVLQLYQKRYYNRAIFLRILGNFSSTFFTEHLRATAPIENNYSKFRATAI